MIRFKKLAAAAVPVPPDGYAALFVDAATGLPAAKDSTDTVIPLKGTPGENGVGVPVGGTVGQFIAKTEGGTQWVDPPAGALPAGGAVGQVVTKSADGAIWADAAAGGESAGEWTDVLGEVIWSLSGPDDAPDDITNPIELRAFLTGIDDRPSSEQAGLVAYLQNLTITHPGKRVAGVRMEAAAAAVYRGRDNVYDENGEIVYDGGEAVTVDVQAMLYASVGRDYYEIGHIENNATAAFGFEFVAPLEDLAFGVCVGDLFDIHGEPGYDYLRFEITRLDVLLVDSILSFETSQLPMTPIPVIGHGRGSSGGFNIHKEGDLAETTTIAIVGCYDNDLPLIGDPAEIYAPALRVDDWVEVSPAIEIPETETGWESNALADIGAGEVLCKVSLDGAAPVLALIANNPGT